MEQQQMTEEILFRTFPISVHDHANGTENLLKQRKANAIRSTKYTLLNWLPKSIFDQFRRIANAYFLGISILMAIGTYATYLFLSPLTPYSTVATLLIILLITSFKEGYEDLLRRRSDKYENNREVITVTFESDGSVKETVVKSKIITPGTIIKLEGLTPAPVDMLLILTSMHHDGNKCYIETANIDGETNLKLREAPSLLMTNELSALIAAGKPVAELFKGNVEIEEPNANIHKFIGTLKLTSAQDAIPFDGQNIVLRSALFSNTEWAYGIAIYTGQETKIQMNSLHAPSKMSKLELQLNMAIKLIFLAQILLVSASVLSVYLLGYDDITKIPYVYLPGEGRGSILPLWLELWFVFFLLYNNFIPLSLYVTIEIVNLGQSFLIGADEFLYHEGLDVPCTVRASNLVQELGMVSNIFTDKTGTLTRNEMKLVKYVLHGQIYNMKQVAAAVAVEIPSTMGGGDGSNSSASSEMVSSEFTMCSSSNSSTDDAAVMNNVHTAIKAQNNDNNNNNIASSSSNNRKQITGSLINVDIDDDGYDSSSGDEDSNNSNSNENKEDNFIATFGNKLQVTRIPSQNAASYAANTTNNTNLTIRGGASVSNNNSNNISLSPPRSTKPIRINKDGVLITNTAGSNSPTAAATTPTMRDAFSFSISSIDNSNSSNPSNTVQLNNSKKDNNNMLSESKPYNNNNNSSSIQLTTMDTSEEPGREELFNFLRCLMTCHTVVRESNGTYRAESPDELALVQGASTSYQCQLIERGSRDMQLQILGQEYSYQILAVNPFNADRKRMSVLLRETTSSDGDGGGEYLVVCKGADNIMLPLCLTASSSSNFTTMTEEQEEGEEDDRLNLQASGFGSDASKKCSDIIHNHNSNSLKNDNIHAPALLKLSNEGLRTLVIAQRKLSAAQATAWLAQYQAATVSSSGNRDALIAAAGAKLEKGLEIVGITAIEDRLQDEVPEVIADLTKAGIIVWMLTGDKLETAVNIGYSCNLLQPGIHVAMLSGIHSPSEFAIALKQQHDTLFEKLAAAATASIGIARNSNSDNKKKRNSRNDDDDDCAAVMIDLESSRDTVNTATPIYKNNSNNNAANINTVASLVLDGPSFTHFDNNDPEQCRLLLEIGRNCRSVIACRLTPLQKRQLVALVKNDRTPGIIPATTLSIGDGANDVSMILEANVGVGIFGKEGRQAANNADFAIGEFKFLRRLLLVHGRWNYVRQAKVFLYSMHKNMVITMTLFWFSYYTFVSGTSPYESWIYSSFNFILGLPIIFFGVLDRDLSDQFALRHPQVYATGRLDVLLNLSSILQWIGNAMLYAVVICGIFYVSVYRSFYDASLYVAGTIVFTGLCVSLQFKVMFFHHQWARPQIGSMLFSFFGMFTFFMLIAVTLFDYANVADFTYNLPLFWFTAMFLVPVSAIFVDWIPYYFRVFFCPTQEMLYRELEMKEHYDDLNRLTCAHNSLCCNKKSGDDSVVDITTYDRDNSTSSGNFTNNKYAMSSIFSYNNMGKHNEEEREEDIKNITSIVATNSRSGRISENDPLDAYSSHHGDENNDYEGFELEDGQAVFHYDGGGSNDHGITSANPKNRKNKRNSSVFLNQYNPSIGTK